MALILLVTTNLFHTALSQSSVCIWGSDYKSGLYTDSGSNTSDGKSYYTKSAPPGCTDNDYYIYYLSIYDEWTIGNVLGEDYYIDAYCTANTSSLSGCTTNTWWKYSSVNSSWEFSPDMYVSMNVASCPTHTWDCDTIHIPSLSSGGCDSVFDVKLDTNLWTESTNTWYWYWNDWDFQWQCDNEPPSSGICSTVNAATDQRWIDITSGQSTTLEFYYPVYTSHTVNCIMDPLPSLSPAESIIAHHPTAQSSTHEPTKAFGEGEVLVITTLTPRTSVKDYRRPHDENNNDTYWTPVYVSLAVMLSCIICVIIMCLYYRKMDHDKAKADQNKMSHLVNESVVSDKPKTDVVNANYAIELQVPNTHVFAPRERVPSASQYAENDDDEKEREGDLDTGDIIPGSVPDGADNLGTTGATQGENDDGIFDWQSGSKHEERNQIQREELREWLEEKLKFGQYYDVFVDNGYESLDIVKEITDQNELKEIGIVLKGHLLKLMTEIKKLKPDVAMETTK
eukprot:514982_1